MATLQQRHSIDIKILLLYIVNIRLIKPNKKHYIYIISYDWFKTRDLSRFS